MIRVTIEIVPGGNERKTFSQAGAEIVCLPGGDGMTGDYAVSIGENQNPCVPALDWTARGHVLGHDRRQTVWALIEKVARFAVLEAEKAQQ